MHISALHLPQLARPLLGILQTYFHLGYLFLEVRYDQAQHIQFFIGVFNLFLKLIYEWDLAIWICLWGSERIFFDLAVLLFLVLLFFMENILEDLNEDILFIVTRDTKVVIAYAFFDIVGLKFVVQDTDIHWNANRVILFIFTLS